jgi:hypothetical protein
MNKTRNIFWVEMDDKHYLALGNPIQPIWTIRVPLFLARLLNNKF